MTGKTEKKKDRHIPQEINKEIRIITSGIVARTEIEQMKKECEQQLMNARQQSLIWDTKMKQLTGSLATYNTILENMDKQAMPKPKIEAKDLRSN